MQVLLYFFLMDKINIGKDFLVNTMINKFYLIVEI